ncbi:MAG: flagellar basal body P-ring formation protein FlgA [Candidatus Latescibacteria bacterium]|nr:flagellar basal body P-ring formation protein FlgA [Candidatus Latescibacterota bacterium]
MVYAAVVPAERIRDAIIDILMTRADASGIEIEVSVKNMVDIEVRNVDSPTMNVIIPEDSKIDSRVPVRIEFSDESGGIRKRFQVMAQIKIMKTVVVACSEINRGEPVNIDDVEMKKIDVTGMNTYFETPSLLEGMQTKRSVRPGMVLNDTNVCPIPVVNRGDPVTIKVFIGNIRAVAEGIARQDGGVGEMIKVYNEMTRTTLDCMIIDGKTVRTGL